MEVAIKIKKYTLAREYNGCPIGTEVIVRENDDTHILVSIDGTLEYMPKIAFWIITGQV